MTGVEYYRRSNCLSQTALGRRAGLSRRKIAAMEECPPKGSYADFEIAARALGVAVGDLLMVYGNAPKAIREVQLTAEENIYNAITHYRLEKNLSFRALGKRLYRSAVAAKAACMTDAADDELVAILAQYEGITPEGFRVIYREGEPV